MMWRTSRRRLTTELALQQGHHSAYEPNASENLLDHQIYASHLLTGLAIADDAGEGGTEDGGLSLFCFFFEESKQFMAN